MTWLHTWGGLWAGWVLFAIFLTGTLGVFDDAITRWMKPERPLVAEVAPGSAGQRRAAGTGRPPGSDLPAAGDAPGRILEYRITG